MAPLMFGEKFSIGKVAVVVSAPVARTDNQSRYGAKSWTVHIRLENAGDRDAPGPQWEVRCADGKEGADWANSTIAEFANVPMGSYLEGDAILSTPIDKYDDPAVLHVCGSPKLRVGDHLSPVLS